MNTRTSITTLALLMLLAVMHTASAIAEHAELAGPSVLTADVPPRLLMLTAHSIRAVALTRPVSAIPGGAGDETTAVDGGRSMADYCRAQFDAATRARRVNFRFGSDELRASSFALLDALVEILADCPPATLVVTGHTDASGHPAFNLDLSRRRAAAVVDYIARRGISGNRLSARGVGASEPLDDSDSSAARARNRRIEFELVFR